MTTAEALPAADFPRLAEAQTVPAACAAVVEDLPPHHRLLSVYLLGDGRLRCVASRGYPRVFDGFPPTQGVIGSVVTSGTELLLTDVDADPHFLCAVSGVRSEACVPVHLGGVVVGAVNLEALGPLGPDDLADVRVAARALGARLAELGGLSPTSVAERVARLAVELSGRRDVAAIRTAALRGAVDLGGTTSAAVASKDAKGQWRVEDAVGPLGPVLLGLSADALRELADTVWVGSASYCPDGERVTEHAVVPASVRALGVQPMAVAGEVTGLLLRADAAAVPHDATTSAAIELLASHLAAVLAMAASLEAAERLARLDPLTQVANRRQLLDLLVAADRTQAQALLLVDLDGFKTVNDRHGHAAGDDLLVRVAQALVAATGDRDLVCRLGGDEFAVLLTLPLPEATSPGAVQQVGQDCLDAVRRAAEQAGHAGVTASGGLRRLEPGLSASACLVDADVAMYAAKGGGWGRCVLWDAELGRAVGDDEALMGDLVRAIERDELSLVYQPVVDVPGLRVHGLEALARWRHPTRGEVPPEVFVACAERHGRVQELTRWVLRAAFAQARAWPPRPDGAVVNVAVNISAAQLGDSDVVRDVQAALASAGLDPHRVVLEVTETARVVDLDLARQTLQQLADLGVALALDDFGTGWASLSHLTSLPFSALKIDRTFVAAAAEGDQRAWATIAAVCTLAGRLGVDVVAEGVEDRGQLVELRALGVRYAQGHALSRPLSATGVQAALHSPSEGGWALTPRVSPAT